MQIIEYLFMRVPLAIIVFISYAAIGWQVDFSGFDISLHLLLHLSLWFYILKKTSFLNIYLNKAIVVISILSTIYFILLSIFVMDSNPLLYIVDLVILIYFLSIYTKKYR